MFNAMNEKELTNVNGGTHYVPVYDKYGNVIGYKPYEPVWTIPTPPRQKY